jgi:hypothetical protein
VGSASSFFERLPDYVEATKEEVDERLARAKYAVWLRDGGNWKGFFAEDIKIEGAFVRAVPKLVLHVDGKYLRPTFDKEIIVPANMVEIIEDPEPAGGLKGWEGVALWAALTFWPRG